MTFGFYSLSSLATNYSMKEKLPQKFLLQYSLNEVWKTTLEEQKKIVNTKILVKDDTHNILSWIVLLNKKTHHNTLKKNVILNTFLPSITSVWLKPHAKNSNKCWLYIRQIYYPSQSMQGISHSRGNYEHYFIEQLRLSLSR